MSSQPQDGIPAPEYYVLQPDKEFDVILPDDSRLRICTPLDIEWEIRRYDNRDPQAQFPIERFQLRRIHPVDGEQTEPMMPPAPQDK